jgi:hypothetical protein
MINLYKSDITYCIAEVVAKGAKFGLTSIFSEGIIVHDTLYQVSVI